MHPASIRRYPAEQIFLREGALAAVGLYLLIGGAIILLAFLTHVKSIQQLMAEGGSIAQDGPAPEQNVEVLLLNDLPPPPPTPAPEFVKQVEIPKPPPVLPPPPKPEPPKPRPPVIKPAYTAPRATGSGQSAAVAKAIVGSSGFPRPAYPYQARIHHQTGTVMIGIQFDGTGAPSNVDVVSTSGFSQLDSYTSTFISAHWRNESFAGRYVTVPVDYKLN